jgi:hypothetical protein
MQVVVVKLNTFYMSIRDGIDQYFSSTLSSRQDPIPLIGGMSEEGPRPDMEAVDGEKPHFRFSRKQH